MWDISDKKRIISTVISSDTLKFVVKEEREREGEKKKERKERQITDYETDVVADIVIRSLP